MWKGWVRPEKGKRGHSKTSAHLSPPYLLLKVQIGKPVKQFNHTAAPAKSGRGGKSRLCLSLWLKLSLQICIHSNNISLNYFVEINDSGSPCLPSLSFPGAARSPPAGGQDMNRCCNSPKISPAAAAAAMACTAAAGGAAAGSKSSSDKSSSGWRGNHHPCLPAPSFSFFFFSFFNGVAIYWEATWGWHHKKPTDSHPFQLWTDFVCLTTSIVSKFGMGLFLYN